MIRPYASEPRRVRPRGWMITFADLLSLVLAFFVLLFAMSKVEIDSWKAVVEALSSRLNPLSSWSRPQLETERSTPKLFDTRTMDLDYLAGLLQTKLSGDATLGKSILHRLEDRLVVSLPGDLLFPVGESRLLADSQGAVVALASALKLFGNSIELVGHSEAEPPAAGSPFNSNWDLTLARALSLADGLRKVGYNFHIKVIAAADAGAANLSAKLPDQRRRSLARRIDLVIHETGATGGSDAP